MTKQPASDPLLHHDREALRHDSPKALSEQQARLLQLLQNQALAIVDSSDDAIYAKTLDGVIASWNRAAERIYGYSASEAIGRPVSMLCPPELHNELPRIILKIKKGERVDHYETIRMKKDGSRICVSVTVSPILNIHGTTIGASTIARDISDQKRSEESIRHLATHDSLTDLANYASLLEAFQTELRRSDRTGRPFALLLLDVDRLKAINDTHGHLAGTRALCRLAAILKRTCRSIDTAARYGGDEFAVLLVETDEFIASRVTQRIANLLARDDANPSFTVSAGIAVYPQHGHTVENLIGAADRSLYKNKLRENLHVRISEGEVPDAAGAPIGAERRRSERLLLDVALVVRGESTERTQFQEKTFTISISAHGALVVMATKVDIGQRLILRNPHTQNEMEGRVVRFGSPYGGLAQIGIEFAQPAPQFWHVESLRTVGERFTARNTFNPNSR